MPPPVPKSCSSHCAPGAAAGLLTTTTTRCGGHLLANELALFAVAVPGRHLLVERCGCGRHHHRTRWKQDRRRWAGEREGGGRQEIRHGSRAQHYLVLRQKASMSCDRRGPKRQVRLRRS